jgi:tellurite methyltransferase
MPVDDAARWNQRYLSAPQPSFLRPRDFLVQHAGDLPGAGLALDAAMGLGGNAAFLISRGLRVIGVDISVVAARQAKARLPALNAVVADLTRFSLPAASLDVILNFYYLDRELWPVYRRALRPGGVLVMETFTADTRAQRGDLNPNYLLQPGELGQAFRDWDVLNYREGWNAPDDGRRRSTASLIARRPRNEIG